LGNKAVPKVEGKIFVDTAESGDHVVFKCADRSLGGVATVDTWRDELVVDVGVGHKLFENRGALVIQSLELGSEPSLAEFGMQTLVAC
jgi:hypothetical protein